MSVVKNFANYYHYNIILKKMHYISVEIYKKCSFTIVGKYKKCKNGIREETVFLFVIKFPFLS